MALSFILLAIAFGLFIQAAATESIVWFLFASFICGAANAVLQASVNPYVTILGPIESAAKRISIMGICNKLAWPATTLFYYLSNRQNHRPNKNGRFVPAIWYYCRYFRCIRHYRLNVETIALATATGYAKALS